MNKSIYTTADEKEIEITKDESAKKMNENGKTNNDNKSENNGANCSLVKAQNSDFPYEFGVPDMTPDEMVAELDKYIVGQADAKRAMAIAIRNRWRRKHIIGEMKNEVVPPNIMMIGQTGIGKTAIANRIASITSSPFIKVEATKFTEIGYVGRDVDSIIRDLVDIAVRSTKIEVQNLHRPTAIDIAHEKVLDIIIGKNTSENTRKEYIERYKNGDFDNNIIEFSVTDWSTSSMGHSFDIPGGQIGMLNIGDLIQKTMGGKKKKHLKMAVKEAREEIVRDELENIIEKDDSVTKLAIQRVQEYGIVFIDEIDKIASRSGNAGGKPDVSKEGVQRDLLPLVEGTTVNTKHGAVSTQHILFIAAGAFHVAKPSDLLPELQGRFSVRVQLNPLTQSDILRILTEKQYNLPEQHKALLAVEGLNIEFTPDALERISELTIMINDSVENMGARRLHTIFERLLEDISFNAHNIKKEIKIDVDYVNDRLAEFIEGGKDDLARFIL